MTVNVTMLTYGRPRLTQQALVSLSQNTNPHHYSVTLFNDEGKLGTGNARNRVISRTRDQGHYLYLSDNDVYFKPHWLEALIECYEYANKIKNVLVIGAYGHPYNQPVERWPFFCKALNAQIEVCEVYAVSTQSWLMTWETWRRYGYFNETPPGAVRMSEDWEYCQRIRNDGFKVATVLPPLIYTTGLTDTHGKLVLGSELIEKPEGVIVE